MNRSFGRSHHLHLQGGKSAEQESSESRWVMLVGEAREPYDTRKYIVRVKLRVVNAEEGSRYIYHCPVWMLIMSAEHHDALSPSVGRWGERICYSVPLVVKQPVGYMSLQLRRICNSGKQTDSMKQGPAWEVSSRTANQEIRRCSWNLEVRCRVHKSPPLNEACAQIHPLQATHLSSLKLNSVAFSPQANYTDRPTERPPPVGEVSANFCW
jgi:hypothetical protein